MVETIGNPLTWIAQALGFGSRTLGPAVQELGGTEEAAPVVVQDLALSDIREVLSLGAKDFMALRTDVLFIVVIYPVIGLMLTWFAFNRDFFYLLFPLASGFALLGPAAAVGLYAMSRRRERGLDTSWADGFKVITSPSIAPILAMSGFLVGIFFVWMLFAHLLYGMTVGPMAPASIGAFLSAVFTTGPGWAMMLLGTGIGFLFAVCVLAVSLTSFPMLVDRHVGLPVAVSTSVKVTRQNPKVVAAWGATVVVLLGIGVATVFLGLIFVLPVLGHATWHLYRRAVAPLNNAAEIADA